MSTESSVSPDERTYYDAIIVGAGPTGLTLANLLGLEGVSVLVIERNPTTVQEPRAVSIDDESLRTMQAAGLLQQVMAHVVAGYGSSYLTRSGRRFLSVMPVGRPYGHPRRNAFRQPILEAQLRQGLDRFGSVQSRFGWTATGFAQTDAHVSVQIECEGRTQSVRGSYLIGCDGASSSIRKQLGITLEGETLPERWLIVDLANSPAQRDTLVFCDAERPCIALPGPNLTRRFEFKLFAQEDEATLLRAEFVQALLRQRGAAPQSTIVRKTVYTFHARIAARWSHGRVLLAGDAAHLTPPFAGQGMNSGIRDAHNLSWKIAAVVAGTMAPLLLSTYEAERRGHVREMIELALRMGRIMGPSNRFTGWLMQTAFIVAGAWPALRSYFGEMKYKPKPRFRQGFLRLGAHPLVGRLVPQPLVTKPDGSECLLDDALPKGFVLLGVGVSTDELTQVMRNPLCDWLKPAAVLLDQTDQRHSPVISSLRASGSELTSYLHTVLTLRPDRYVMAALVPGRAEKRTTDLTAYMPQNQGE